MSGDTQIQSKTGWNISHFCIQCNFIAWAPTKKTVPVRHAQRNSMRTSNKSHKTFKKDFALSWNAVFAPNQPYFPEDFIGNSNKQIEREAYSPTGKYAAPSFGPRHLYAPVRQNCHLPPHQSNLAGNQIDFVRKCLCARQCQGGGIILIAYSRQTMSVAHRPAFFLSSLAKFVESDARVSCLPFCEIW